MSDAGLAVLGLSVFAGAGTQRITGLGFALVSSPLLVLVAGPLQGVLLANALSLCVNLAVLAVTWRDIELRRTLLLALPALLAVPLGVRVTRGLPAPALLVLVGTLMTAALLAVLASSRARVFRGTAGAVGAGALSGFMNVTAGVGGPAMTLYALSTQWPHTGFVASMQLYFAIVNVGSLAAKGLPDLPLPTVVTVVVALAAGVAAGHWARHRVTAERARSAVIAIALLGAAATTAKGVLTW